MKTSPCAALPTMSKKIYFWIELLLGITLLQGELEHLLVHSEILCNRARKKKPLRF